MVTSAISTDWLPPSSQTRYHMELSMPPTRGVPLLETRCPSVTMGGVTTRTHMRYWADCAPLPQQWTRM